MRDRLPMMLHLVLTALTCALATASAWSQTEAGTGKIEPADASRKSEAVEPGVTATGGTTQGGAMANIADRVKVRDRNAPRREDRTAINLGNKHINAIFGGLEQGAGMGFGIELTTADSIPGIEFRATAITSTKLYRRFELEGYIPKIGDERTHANFWFSYLRRTKDHFFGIGPRTPDEPRTNYDNETRLYQVSFFRDFTDHLEAGVFLGVVNAANYRGQNEDEVPIDSLYSANPNVVPTTRWAPGLSGGSKLLPYGVYFEYDRRDNRLGLTQGGYIYSRLSSVNGLEKTGVFSDFGWVEFDIDVRGYIPLGSHSTSLALRMLSETKSPKGGSQIPFYAQSRLGGRSFVRGFDTFRFHGNNLLLFSTELRRQVWGLKDDRGLDLFFLGDGGQVWGDSRSKTNAQILQNDRFDSANWRFGIGGGVQFRFSEMFSFRVEMAHSNEANKVYFSVGRGF